MKMSRQCMQWEWHSEGQENPCSRKSRMESKKYHRRNMKRVSGHGSRFCQHWDTVGVMNGRAGCPQKTLLSVRVTSNSFSSANDLYECPGRCGLGA